MTIYIVEIFADRLIPHLFIPEIFSVVVAI